MSALIWQEHYVLAPDLRLAWYETGSGPTVICVHGGLGDTHRYLRPVVEPQARQLRCVLYDQRGCGQSRLVRADDRALHVERFVADLETLRLHLGVERITLVGHSWGATLALLYAVAYPGQVDRLALVGMGPISDEMDAVAAANLLKPLSAAEREARASLRLQVERAVTAGDAARLRELRAQEAPLHFRAWFASPGVLQGFLAEYNTEYPPDRHINQMVWARYRQVRDGLQYERVTAPVLIVYGYQDLEPITQAHVLRERMPQAVICLLNDCGHLPWLERSEAFYTALRTFLVGEGGAVSA